MGGIAFGEFGVPNANRIQRGAINAASGTDQTNALLQSLVDRLAPPVQLDQTWFAAATTGALGVATYQTLNGVTINGLMFSLTAGAVDVYLAGQVNGQPHCSQVGPGTFYLPLPPLPNLNQLIYVSSGTVAAVGSVCAFSY